MLPVVPAAAMPVNQEWSYFWNFIRIRSGQLRASDRSMMDLTGGDCMCGEVRTERKMSIHLPKRSSRPWSAPSRSERQTRMQDEAHSASAPS